MATPRAKKLAGQLGVALDTVAGSGPHGRIQAEDVLAAGGQPVSIPRVAEGHGPAVASSGAGTAEGPGRAAPPPGPAIGRPGDTVGVNPHQQAVVRNMAASSEVPS
ncbi:MAG: E3 binding domain-containing protein, partial [Prochlorococcaceae cyanobacterium]